jgi:addiction module RelB/DinJ family antitoxin
MNQQTLEVTLNPILKKKAAKVLDGLGLDMESAVRVFLTKVVATHSIPFALAEEPEAYRFSAKETKDILNAKQESKKAGLQLNSSPSYTHNTSLRAEVPRTNFLQIRCRPLLKYNAAVPHCVGSFVKTQHRLSSNNYTERALCSYL